MDFYHSLVPFGVFEDVSNLDHYKAVPATTVVVLTDIRGSTKAIERGKYREVNTIGASCIAAVRNSLGRKDIAYIFGGDGATFVIDEQDREKAIQALLGVGAMARKNFGLELRIGAIPIADIRAQGADIFVGKYELVKGQSLAVFRGGGLSLADLLVKKDSKYLRQDSIVTAPPDLTGLSCRWEPLKSLNGHMLSLIVQGRDREDFNLYQFVISNIQTILGADLGTLNPVQVKNMKLKWVPRSGAIEAGLNGMNSFYLWSRLKVFMASAFVKLLVATNIPLGTFRGDRYVRETSSHADYKKFDDMLRMVLDCSVENGNLVLEFLESLRSQNKIFYGYQKSETALMTCLVFSSVDDHVHFVDGADGGYALAAQVMKAQMAAARSDT
jgi:hypothetical protein